MKNYIFTSESITERHLIKSVTALRTSILDEALRQDPASKWQWRQRLRDDFVLITVRLIPSKLEYEEIARGYSEIGYTEEYGL
ncbi:MAG: S-adenosylmethionine synthetase N-terminal domain-containing protein [Clostridium sp.]